MEGLIVVIIGGSGVGKTATINELLKRPEYRRPRSTTTRKQRASDPPGEYEYISHEEMERRDRNGELIWKEEYGGEFYAGVPERIIEALRLHGTVSVMALVPKVLQRLVDFILRHEHTTRNLVVIFINSPGIEELERRAIADGRDLAAQRVRWREERDWEAQVRAIPNLSAVFVDNPNGKLDETVAKIRSIIDRRRSL